MGARSDGGPAFPQFAVDACQRDGHGDLIEPFTTSEGGMCLRDWFAGQALTGLLAANATYGGRTDNREKLAGDAYQHADAMLKARARPEPTEGE